MNGSEIVLRKENLEVLERMAQVAVRSGLFGVKSAEQALALMLVAQAEGLHPMQAVKEYHIINGRPVLRADAMLARFQRAGGSVEWIELADTAVEAVFSHPQGGKARIRWTVDDAKRAGIFGQDNWKKYPRAMLRARVISEGVRTVYPGVVTGVYTPEEMMDAQAEPTTVVEVQSLPKQEESTGESKVSITPAQLRALNTAYTKAGANGGDRELVWRHAGKVLGREVKSLRELTKEEAKRLLKHIEETDLTLELDALRSSASNSEDQDEEVNL